MKKLYTTIVAVAKRVGITTSGDGIRMIRIPKNDTSLIQDTQSASIHHIEINKENFPDAALREYIQGLFSYNQTSLTYAEILNITTVDLSGSYIKNLKGIECFKNIHTLLLKDCVWIQRIQLPKNSSLKHLDVSGCKSLHDLQITNMTSLQYLNISGVTLNTLDLQNNYELTAIQLRDSSIESIQFGNNTNVKSLYLSAMKEQKTDAYTSEKANNCLTSELCVNGWVYGETPNTPQASVLYGDITYEYRNINETCYTTDIPTTAGIWYVRARVSESKKCKTFLSDPVAFTIDKALPNYEKPKPLRTCYGSLLRDIELPRQFCWVDASLQVGALGKRIFKAIYEPMDRVNYKSLIINVEVTVEKIHNEWTQELKMSDWVYGNVANTPTAIPRIGTVMYTFSKHMDGPYIATKPNNAGIWYVKASVDEKNTYTALESIKQFTIHKAMPTYTIPPELSICFGGVLERVQLPKCFSWKYASLRCTTLGKCSYTAIYTPLDTRNYKQVEIELQIHVVVA